MKYAVIYAKQVHHEGDERSRTNPGHGYPAYTENFETIKKFDTQEQLKTWIKNTSESKFEVIEYQELTFQKEVVINFKKPAATRVS